MKKTKPVSKKIGKAKVISKSKDALKITKQTGLRTKHGLHL